MKFNKYQRLANRIAPHEESCLNEEHRPDIDVVALGIGVGLDGIKSQVKLNIFYGAPINNDEIIDDLGYILQHIALASKAIGVTMDEVAKRSVEGLKIRYPDKFQD